MVLARGYQWLTAHKPHPRLNGVAATKPKQEHPEEEQEQPQVQLRLAFGQLPWPFPLCLPHITVQE